MIVLLYDVHIYYIYCYDYKTMSFISLCIICGPFLLCFYYQFSSLYFLFIKIHLILFLKVFFLLGLGI